MKNIVILIHKKREDLEIFIREFPNTYIYMDTDTDFENSHLVKIEHSTHNPRDVIGNGIRHIHKDLPDSGIILVNECTSIEDVKLIGEELQKADSVVIGTNDINRHISSRKMKGIQLITKLYNMVHRQQASNIMSNVQGIPAKYVEHFVKLRGGTCNALINERFIIKDHSVDYRCVDIKSNVYTDAPESFFGYVKCTFIICFVFIKFMLSSMSAFLVDYSLSLLGYNIWSPMVVAFFAGASFSAPKFLLDVEIVSTLIARTVSSVYNYSLNKRVVFGANGNVAKLSTGCKYFALVLIIWVFNTIILKLATTYLNIPFAFAKIIADIIMYFISFSVQRDIVFKKRNN